MHLTEAEVTTLAHGELPDAQGGEAFLHLAKCEECARRYDGFLAAERDVERLLHALDHAAPRVTADSVIGRAVRRPFPPRAAIAAGITVLVIAGTAAAAAGSPIRRYIERILAAARPPIAPRPPSGIAFVTTSGVDVRFRAEQRTGVIRVKVGADAMLSITHNGGTAGYALTDHGLSVENSASTASYEITIPGAAAYSRILVGDRVVFFKDGARIASPFPRDSAGSYRITFSPRDSGTP